MHLKNKIPPYIGITDFEDASQVKDILSLFPENHRRSLMIGVMMSYKVLRKIHTKWAAVWPIPEMIHEIFIDHPKAFNTLHWADYNNDTSFDDLTEACVFCGSNLRALQLDMIWPAANLLYRFKNKLDIPIILQVGAEALDLIDGSPSELEFRMRRYGNLVDGVLLDKSMGKGKGMDAESLRPFVKTLVDKFPDLHVAVAGGLGPDSLHLVKPLMDEFPNLSIDAQGQFRDSVNAMDPINWARARDYINKSLSMFP